MGGCPSGWAFLFAVLPAWARSAGLQALIASTATATATVAVMAGSP